jgi:50S ribosomal protein L16 3-hydroxylase
VRFDHAAHPLGGQALYAAVPPAPAMPASAALAILAAMNRALRQLLGGHAPEAFLRSYWHKKPLLVEAALPVIPRLLTRAELFALATRDDVQSRLVQRTGRRYIQHDGPFKRAQLERLPARNWTLLVQGVNLHDDGADALLRRFAFIPYARLDDLMVSYAVPGGGVGPHYDSYDVFLLQASGRRRWRHGRQQDLRLVENAPLRILARFTPEHEATLAPGDMLYLPPDHAHDGVALDECMTYSIGFRAPAHQELAEAFLDHLRDTLAAPGRYADPDLRPTKAPARIDRMMQRQVARALAAIRWNDDDIARFLGRYLSEPKPEVVFTAGAHCSRARFERRMARAGVRLDRRTQLLYDSARCYINGDELPLPASGGDDLRTLADRRTLPPQVAARLSPELAAILYDWHRHGFLADPA